MGVLTQADFFSFIPTESWQAETLALADESHLVACSNDADERARFAGHMSRFIQQQSGMELVTIFGSSGVDLMSVGAQLARQIGESIGAVSSVSALASLLRRRDEDRACPAARHRFILWHDADELIRRDHCLFGRIVDAIAGVSAELEYASDERLLIQRLVLVGGSLLEVYAQDERGQVRSWFDDGLGEPLWRVITGVAAPAFTVRRVDQLMGLGAGA